MARPTKLDSTLLKKIVRLVKDGHFAIVAARSAGISETTFYRWLEMGRKAEDGDEDAAIYREFWERIEEAKAQAEVDKLKVINAVMRSRDAQHKDKLKAAMFWLERRAAGRYSPKSILELEGSVEVKREVEELSDDELARIASGGG